MVNFNSLRSLTLPGDVALVVCVGEQLEEAVEALGGREVSPEENRIVELKQELVALDQRMNESQSFWLKLQQHLVHLNEKRSTQT